MRPNLKEIKNKSGIVADACDLRMWESEAGGLLGVKGSMSSDKQQ